MWSRFSLGHFIDFVPSPVNVVSRSTRSSTRSPFSTMVAWSTLDLWQTQLRTLSTWDTSASLPRPTIRSGPLLTRITLEQTSGPSDVR
jgi:hypothetical protein